MSTEMKIGESYKFTTTATVGSITEFDEAIVEGIMSYTTAMTFANIDGLLDEWKNNTNIATLIDVDLKDRLYYQVKGVSGSGSLIIPDFLIVDGSIEKISPSTITLEVQVETPSSIDGLKDYLRVAGLSYTIK